MRRTLAAITKQKLPVVKFGRGFSIIQEDKKITACKEWKQIRDHFQNNTAYDVIGPNPVNFSMDGMSVSRSGTVTIPGHGDYFMMYETAFQQLLSTLELPNFIAEKMPVDVLVAIINGLIQDNFTRNATVKFTNGAIYSFGFSNANKPMGLSASQLFEHLNSKEVKQQHKMDFLFGVNQGFRSNLVMKFSDYRDKEVGGAFEILFSDAMDCKPRVTGVVVTPKGHIFIRSLSFVVDTSDIEKAYDMMSSYITRIYGEIDKYVKLHPKMESTKLTAETLEKVTSRASKCLRNYSNKPLKIEVGMTVDKVFDALLEHREGASIMAKRDMAYFCFDLLDLCAPMPMVKV